VSGHTIPTASGSSPRSRHQPGRQDHSLSHRNSGLKAYLNDVRFDLPVGTKDDHGIGGFACITDSSSNGTNGIVADLATGKSWRRLNNYSSTLPEPGFVIFAEG
jgi:hypothetical protein